MTAEAAATIIQRGLARDDAIIAFPTIMYIFVHTLSTLPATVCVRASQATYTPYPGIFFEIAVVPNPPSCVSSCFLPTPPSCVSSY